MGGEHNRLRNYVQSKLAREQLRVLQVKRAKYRAKHASYSTTITNANTTTSETSGSSKTTTGNVSEDGSLLPANQSEVGPMSKGQPDETKFSEESSAALVRSVDEEQEITDSQNVFYECKSAVDADLSESTPRKLRAVIVEETDEDEEEYWVGRVGKTTSQLVGKGYVDEPSGTFLLVPNQGEKVERN